MGFFPVIHSKCLFSQVTWILITLIKYNTWKVTIKWTTKKNNHLMMWCGYNLFLDIQVWRRMGLEIQKNKSIAKVAMDGVQDYGSSLVQVKSHHHHLTWIPLVASWWLSLLHLLTPTQPWTFKKFSEKVPILQQVLRNLSALFVPDTVFVGKSQ